MYFMSTDIRPVEMEHFYSQPLLKLSIWHTLEELKIHCRRKCLFFNLVKYSFVHLSLNVRRHTLLIANHICSREIFFALVCCHFSWPSHQSRLEWHFLSSCLEQGPEMCFLHQIRSPLPYCVKGCHESMPKGWVMRMLKSIKIKMMTSHLNHRQKKLGPKSPHKCNFPACNKKRNVTWVAFGLKRKTRNSKYT